MATAHSETQNSCFDLDCEFVLFTIYAKAFLSFIESSNEFMGFGAKGTKTYQSEIFSSQCSVRTTLLQQLPVGSVPACRFKSVIVHCVDNISSTGVCEAYFATCLFSDWQLLLTSLTN